MVRPRPVAVHSCAHLFVRGVLLRRRSHRFDTLAATLGGRAWRRPSWEEGAVPVAGSLGGVSVVPAPSSPISPCAPYATSEPFRSSSPIVTGRPVRSTVTTTWPGWH